MPLSRMLFNRAAIAAALLVMLTPRLAHAAEMTKVKFSLDWTVGASTAAYILARDRGYFAEEGVDVSIDPGKGGSSFVERLVGGVYDIAVGDMTPYIQYLGNNPDDDTMRAVYVASNESPYAFISLSKNGINKPADIMGKKIASAAFAATRAAWPVFAKVNNLSETGATWQLVDPAVRGAMLVQGSADLVAGFTTDVPLFAHLGVAPDQFSLIKYKDHGVQFYSNTLVASRSFIGQKPKAVAAFVRAANRGLKALIEDPEAAIAAVKKANPLIDESTERQILDILLRDVIVTPETRKNGLGAVTIPRLSAQVDEIASTMQLRSKPPLDRVFTPDFLPAEADRQIH
ncbi:MAG TPA: ABC transporter substrate-binding protein [Xanthobacteraceae bacterium]|nr:ABC transporter substrate-binding protein [Xanthobacteraceae bacterium]